MPEQTGYKLEQVRDQSIVRLRIHPDAAEHVSQALELPQALHWRDSDPRVCWLGPDQWLLTSNTRPAGEIIGHIGQMLPDVLHAPTDMSSGNASFTLKGPAARKLLAMGCGIDMHPSAFTPGQCVRTNFALVSLFIVAVEDDRFDLFVDRSYARYLENWIAAAGEDPVIYTEGTSD